MNLFNLGKSSKKSPDNFLGDFIATQKRVDKLPPLTDVEKVKFDQGVDLDHLYNSSKIEGTNLTEDEMRRAIGA